MKIYTEITIDMRTGVVESEESFEYSGPVAMCGGGGGGGGKGGAPSYSPPAAIKQRPAAKTSEAEDTTSDNTTGGGNAALKKRSAYALSMEEQGDQTKKPLYRGSLYGQSKLSS